MIPVRAPAGKGNRMNPIVMAEGCAKAQRQLPRPAWRGEGGGEGSRFLAFMAVNQAKNQNLLNNTPHPNPLPAKRREGISRPLPKPMAFMRLPWPAGQGDCIYSS